MQTQSQRINEHHSSVNDIVREIVNELAERNKTIAILQGANRQLVEKVQRLEKIAVDHLCSLNEERTRHCETLMRLDKFTGDDTPNDADAFPEPHTDEAIQADALEMEPVLAR